MINGYDKYSVVEALDIIMCRADLLTDDEIEKLKNTIDDEKKRRIDNGKITKKRSE